jgi:multidrug resistance efflux pump
MRKILFRVILLAIAVLAAWQGYRLFDSMPQRQRDIATTNVRRGDVIVRSYARGELRAVRSATLTAPNLFGTVQVTRLAALGAFAKEKDLVVEFDDSEVRSRLEEKDLEIQQVDEQIKKAEADLAIRNNQDGVELLQARYTVRRAALEVRRNELVSKIDAQKNLLSQEEAKRRLQRLESDIKSRREQAEAQIEVLRQQKNKSLLELEREKMRLSQVRLLAPISGLVAIKQNIAGSFRMFGMSLPDIREGDQVQPGMPIADVLDLSELEVIAKVGELDRANLREGQDVVIELDAVPGKRFTGRIKALSGTASANLFSSDPAKKFDVAFSLDMQQLMNALGAKPEQIRRVLEQAEQNRKKPPMQAATFSTAQFDPTQGGGGAPGAAAGGPGQAPGQQPPAQGNRGAGRPPEGAQRAGAAAAGRPADAKSARRRGPGIAEMRKMFDAMRQFSDADLAKAQLPPPPEEDAGLDVLLRPGLLADVEIIVEKIPSAIHVPNQAVFEKEGRHVVFVKGHSGFEARPIQIAKRSESTTVIRSGLKEGEQIALSDPTVKKNDKKGSAGGAGAPGGLPAGGKK